MVKKLIILGCFAFFMVSCKNTENNSAEDLTESNLENNAEMKDNESKEWRSLFNGENLEGWKAFNDDEISDQWQVKDGAIVFDPSQADKEVSENLITEEEFESFELSLEWKISEGGNSGIMWAVQEDEKYNEPYLTGPEIQVLDNKKHPDAKNGPIRQAGALYDMVPPAEDVTNPAGEWNKVLIRIDYDENQGSVTMNGTKINEFPLYGEAWEELVENSKFADWEGFGSSRTGHIALQDHSDKVWFRNIKIKEL